MSLLTKDQITPAVGCIFALLMCLCLTQPAFAVNLLGSDDEVLWKSGSLLYIKLEEQDKDKGGKAQPNDHPVTLEGGEISDALNLIEFWQKQGFFKSADKEPDKVFSLQQTRLLGQYIAEGLAKAKPGQDIIFALSRLQKLGLGMKDTVYDAGRVFYKDNRLHIIIGDYERPRDKGLEAAAGGFGINEIQYFFTHGRRAGASDFKKNLIIGDGVDIFKQGNKTRKDWLVIDIAAASKAFIAKNQKKEQPAGTVDAEAIRIEAARMAKERREMRAEMARMRKEMKDISGNGNEGASAETVEERINTLDELLEKELITREEYEARRKEILNDI